MNSENHTANISVLLRAIFGGLPTLRQTVSVGEPLPPSTGCRRSLKATDKSIAFFTSVPCLSTQILVRSTGEKECANMYNPDFTTEADTETEPNKGLFARCGFPTGKPSAGKVSGALAPFDFPAHLALAGGRTARSARSH